ncbi:hypothetical protein M2323_000575 [Rhodoblastus acidophilus]|uniref:AsmA-like C-terminal region-containing protein n=1 Tax=Rhodoblastus acidophilus TaxID=1074 RepID=UPI00222582E4|nr:AsmA-like C-terminal region-containing protein [Rhodoblastus acidophilus]MCW2282810.1 hypothetical protein [Rhodoblastus acidophilus]MCW2331671.1 hypothetical protein [Rhodoblastus acidophilus]
MTSLRRPARRKTKRRPSWRAAGAILSFVLLSLVIFAGLALYTFAGGRVDLEPLRPLAVSALQDRVGAGRKLTIEGLALERDERGLALALTGIAVRDASDGHKILSAPKADVHVSVTALFTGSIEPKRVDIEDLQVQLRIQPDGGVDMSFGADEAPQAAPQAAPDAPAPDAPPPAAAAPPAPRGKILAQIGHAINNVFDLASGRDSPIAQLDHFGVRRGRLALIDLAAGQTRGFENFAFALDRKRSGGQSLAEVNVAADGPNGRWRLRGEVRGARDEPRALTLEGGGFTIDELALALGKSSLPVDSDISLNLKAEASFQADGHVLDAHARLGLSSGFWRYDDPDFAPTFIDEAFAALRWEPGAHRLVVDQAQVFSGPTRLFLHGAASAPTEPGGPWAIQFEQTEPGTIGPDRANERAITLAGFTGDFSLDTEAKRLDVKRVEMRGPELAAAMQGAIDWVNGPHVRLGISMAKTPAAGVLAIWPNAFGAAPRGWLGDHLQGGIMESLRLAVDLDDVDLRMMRAQIPPMDDRILIDYTLKDVAFTFLEGAPAVTGLGGQGRTTGRATHFTATGGVMESAPGHRIDLSDGQFAMPNIAARPMPLNVVTRARGHVDVLGEILSRPGLEKIANMPLDPKTIRGQFDGTFGYRTFIGPGVGPDEGMLDVSAKVENFSAERLVGKEKLDQGSLVVTVADRALKVVGTGKLFGAAATLEVTQKGVEPAQGLITFVMDEAARAKAGITLGNALTGPMAVKLAGSVGAARQQAQVEVDLAKTTLNYPIPGLYKPAGRPAKASFSYREEERGGATFDQIVFEGGGASARGVAQLGADGGLISAKFSQLKLSPGDSLQLEASKAGETMKITAKGESLDARPFLKSFTRGGDRPDNADVELDLQTTVMSGANRQILSNAVLRLSKKGTNYRALTFSGKLGDDLVEMSLSRPDNGPPLLKATSTDAGGLVAFLDLYDHMEGGRLRAAFRLANGGLAGPVDIEKFILRGEPAIRSFASAPANEQFAARAQLNADMVAFSRLHAVIENRDGVLRVRDGAIASTNIGSTIEGVADFNRDTLDFSGTFVPAYGVNNLFGQLPVVGLILGGGDKEGLIGVNFRVTGRPSAPVLSVNPLSAITPGILRKVFGAFPTDAGN